MGGGRAPPGTPEGTACALLELLGCHHTDKRVETALREYAVRNRPEVKIDEETADGPVVETQSWVKNSRLGIEFGFDDEAAWIGLDETQWGLRPMVLTQVYFYGQHVGVRPYGGALPLDLQLSDDRATVRQKMELYETTRHSHVNDTWDVPGYRITVSYLERGQGIDFVLCSLREPPLPPLGYALPPMPQIATLIGLFGASLDDPALRQALEPLGLQSKAEEIDDSNEADFGTPYGLIVNFASAKEPKGKKAPDILLYSMTFLRERELGGRNWTGEFPFSLDFEDSFETAVRKVGRPPDFQDNEEPFSSTMTWHEPDFSLQLIYSTIENRIFRVGLFAPGFAT